MNDPAAIDLFLKDLSKVELPNVFNPYRDRCPIYDHTGSVGIRRANLRNALLGALRFPELSMWVAQDLGHRGGRRTGLALTDEFHLDHHTRLLQTGPLCKATSGARMAERTAGTVWYALSAINRPIFLWNVFPFHPHCEGRPCSNRSHNRRDERKMGMVFLAKLVELLQPVVIVGIGTHASEALKRSGIPCEYARHPSYGGQNAFLSKLARLYHLPLLATLPSASQPALWD
jgi:hypothetical protein